MTSLSAATSLNRMEGDTLANAFVRDRQAELPNAKIGLC